jgi:hypothetical protein
MVLGAIGAIVGLYDFGRTVMAPLSEPFVPLKDSAESVTTYSPSRDGFHG